MRVAVFGSGTGTILKSLLEARKKEALSFQIVLLFTDQLCRFQTIAKEVNLPLIYHPQKTGQKRIEYDQEALHLIQNFSIDFILLAGFMRLMSSLWLEAFPNRILNIHPADLTSRKYIGKNAVYDALKAGEKRTRTSAILIDETVDGGPIVASGSWVDYDGPIPVTMESAKKHQEKQKEFSDFAVCKSALHWIGAGRIATEDKTIFFDSKKMPIEGVCVESLG